MVMVPPFSVFLQIGVVFSGMGMASAAGALPDPFPHRSDTIESFESDRAVENLNVFGHVFHPTSTSAMSRLPGRISFSEQEEPPRSETNRAMWNGVSLHQMGRAVAVQESPIRGSVRNNDVDVQHRRLLQYPLPAGTTAVSSPRGVYCSILSSPARLEEQHEQRTPSLHLHLQNKYDPQPSSLLNPTGL